MYFGVFQTSILLWCFKNFKFADNGICFLSKYNGTKVVCSSLCTDVLPSLCITNLMARLKQIQIAIPRCYQVVYVRFVQNLIFANLLKTPTERQAKLMFSHRENLIVSSSSILRKCWLVTFALTKDLDHSVDYQWSPAC